MTKTVMFFVLFLTVALVCASAATYQVTLFQASTVAGHELKAGDYKLTVDNDKATIAKGKEKVEATVKVETSDTKYSATSIRYADDNGKMKVQEIRLGGTTTKLVFN
ncbi:hypothetical protein [uncultured Paludibaculum sp.]|uniref:hypothetical protein n=1 Tax=uncultured Paludibaculum sp. TaxID=1765020 RepID=UPI002AAB214E|nr:hypothetical protein [uncultured Paludibaculum sp.]